MEYQNLKFLQESLLQTQNICAWSFTEELQLIHSNCPEQGYFSNLFYVSRCSSVMKEHFTHSITPIILADSIGFAWIAARQEKGLGNSGALLHLLGPIFTSEMTEAYLRQHLFRRQQSAEITERLRSIINEVPVITSDMASRYASLLHYCLNATVVPPREIEIWSEPAEQSGDVAWGDAIWHGTWLSEQRFFQSVIDGRYDGLKELASARVGPMGDGDPLRQTKNEMIVFAVLCSRAAILGGVSAEGALNLSDHFIQQIESAETISSVRNIGEEMHRIYIQRVQKAKELEKNSVLIRSCTEYVEIHVLERITLKKIAKEIGYNEHYISRKFKSETGESLFDYINRRKIDMAKSVLRDSRISIAELSDRLSFSSPSYFSSVFKNYVGMSPAEYQSKLKEEHNVSS